MNLIWIGLALGALSGIALAAMPRRERVRVAARARR